MTRLMKTERPAPGDEGGVHEAPVPLSVCERLPIIRRQHAAPCGLENGLTGGCIPFRRRTEAGIDVGLASGQHAEFQGRAEHYPLWIA